MSSDPVSKYVTVNGLKLHYLDWEGSAGKPPLLMVHGLTREAHAFSDLAPRLADKVHCISMDVRGRGNSDWGPEAGYSIGQYAEDVKALLAELGLKQVHYIGTSMGGMIGMQLAASAPELFLSMTINDMGPEIPTGSSQGVEAHVKRCAQGFDSLTELLDFETRRYPWFDNIPRPFLEESYKHLVRERDGRTWFHFDPNIILGRAASVGRVREEQVARFWQGFGALTCPILLVRGAESNILVPETVEAMQKVQPAMAFVEIPGVGHAPTMSEKPVLAAFDSLYA